MSVTLTSASLQNWLVCDRILSVRGEPEELITLSELYSRMQTFYRGHVIESNIEYGKMPFLLENVIIDGFSDKPSGLHRHRAEMSHFEVFHRFHNPFCGRIRNL